MEGKIKIEFLIDGESKFEEEIIAADGISGVIKCMLFAGMDEMRARVKEKITEELNKL